MNPESDWLFIKARINRLEVSEAASAFDFLIILADAPADTADRRIARDLIARASEAVARIHTPEAGL